eukprot:SAG31_NODE_542_length_14269_cov_7.826253_9_plen_190_part_00
MVLPSECAGSSSGDASCAHTWSPSSHCNDFDGHTTHHKYNCTFSGWWVPHGPRSGLTSFPSGHTFSGWLPLPIMFHWNELPLRCHSLGLTAAVWVILLLWGFTVAASRVFVGAVRLISPFVCMICVLRINACKAARRCAISDVSLSANLFVYTLFCVGISAALVLGCARVQHFDVGACGIPVETPRARQ